MKNNGLDEMQKANRDKIGNQTFLLLSYMLLADMGLYGAGVRWLEYPTNVMVIFMFCMFIYLIRLILGNAYIGPARSPKRQGAKTVALAVVSIVFAAVGAVLLKDRISPAQPEDNGWGAIVLAVSSVVFLVIIGVTALIRSRQNKDQ